VQVVVCGAGVAGLGAALLLARAGCTVTVLEADPDGAPADPAAAWEHWSRAGVAQFHQPHVLLARFRQVLATELPDVLDALRAAGCVEVDPLASLPPTLPDRAPRPGDDRLRILGGRRPVVEVVLAAAAEREPGVVVRRGVRVAGLTTGAEALPGSPHVTGVTTRDGEELAADLVVDATGRRTRSAGWLAAIGARVPAPSSSGRGFVYYTRWFTGPERPVLRGPANTAMGSISLLALEGDARTWSLTVFALSADRPLKALRRPEVFDRVVRAFPLAAPLADGTPLTGVLPIAGVLNTRRDLAVDGRPAVTGLAPLADAWACTNPSGGRGLSVGLVHAQLLRDLVVACRDDPAAFAAAWAARTDEVVGPFYRAQCAADDARIAEMAAAARGEPLPPPAGPEPALAAAAMHDADLFRALLETATCLAQPEEVLARPLVRERLAALGDVEPLRIPGPDRAQLLDLVTA
jgi:2-polyprenyl-6-methoxyphenol hydroxylase-like FAD-dependent oxidoreductase